MKKDKSFETQITDGTQPTLGNRLHAYSPDTIGIKKS